MIAFRSDPTPPEVNENISSDFNCHWFMPTLTWMSLLAITQCVTESGPQKIPHLDTTLMGAIKDPWMDKWKKRKMDEKLNLENCLDMFLVGRYLNCSEKYTPHSRNGSSLAATCMRCVVTAVLPTAFTINFFSDLSQSQIRYLLITNIVKLSPHKVARASLRTLVTTDFSFVKKSGPSASVWLSLSLLASILFCFLSAWYHLCLWYVRCIFAHEPERYFSCWGLHGL